MLSGTESGQGTELKWNGNGTETERGKLTSVLKIFHRNSQISQSFYSPAVVLPCGAHTTRPPCRRPRSDVGELGLWAQRLPSKRLNVEGPVFPWCLHLKEIRPHRRCWGVIVRMALVKGYRFTWGGGGIFRPKPPVFDRS